MFDQTPQQPMYGAPNMNMGGYQYNGVQQQAKIMNNLSAEEIKQLQQQRSTFNINLTEREVLQAGCNHRSLDGMSDSLSFDRESGVARCTICGYQFRPIEPEVSRDRIKDDCDRIVDILQTIKMMHVDFPASAAREYFKIIPLIGKIPELFEISAKDFAKHEFNNWQYNNHNMGGMAMLQNLNTMFGAPIQQQPQMNYGNAAPGFPQAAYQQPVGYQPGANAFGFQGASQQPMGYQPMNQGFQYQPNGVATPVAPTVATPAAPAVDAPAAPVEAATTDTTVTQNVIV